MSETKEKKFDFEDALNRLEEITISLEKGEIKLDNALSLFEEGVALSRKCEKKLSQAERKVEILRITEDDLNEIESEEETENKGKKGNIKKSKKKPTLDLFPDLENNEKL